MGGEYEFTFVSSNKLPFDLEKYQQFVLELRDKYLKHPECVFYKTKEEVPIQDNILAKFKYQCKRHTSWKDEHGTWNILWDPTLDPKYHCDDTHGRCSSTTFKEVHKKLREAFPGKFHIYDDDLDWARRDYLHSGGDDYDSDCRDYTACDSECGYCGGCDY